MVELSRFQQLRPTQTIAEEQKRQGRLPLYPDGMLSDLGRDLLAANDSRAYQSVLAGARQSGHLAELTGPAGVDKVVGTIYAWLQFKARPVRVADLAALAPALKPTDLGVLEVRWRLYADNLLLAIDRGELHVNSCLDYQLLIRICYLIRLCLVAAGPDRFEIAPTATDALIARILSQPILIPERLLHGRCGVKCSQQNRMALPAAPAAPAATRQGQSRNPCECPCDTSCRPPSSHCICIRPFIADLFLIRESLARFEAGDIADIENILAGEKKERRHRTLLRSEDTTETETETETSQERDHEVSEKFSLQSEVKASVDQKVGVDAGVTATIKYGPSVTITPHANVTYNYAKSDSEATARSYSKELVDRSVTKIQEKVRKLTTSKIINETVEKNVHSIDNTQAGADHRAGIYYWVNKVTHGQVYNYGRHMMFDLVVPEPAATFKDLYRRKISKNAADTMPVKPAITPNLITPDTYGQILMQYGISTTDDIQPPQATACVEVAFSHSVGGKDVEDSTVGIASNEFKSPPIPTGYRATSLYYDIRCSVAHPQSTGPDDQVAVTVNVGDHCIFTRYFNEYSQGGGQSDREWLASGNVAMKGETDSVTIAIAGLSSLALGLGGSVSILCELTDEAMAKWQAGIFKLVMADYNRKLDAWKAANDRGDELVQIKGRNPFLNREIERNEFKRHVIAILMCNYFNGIGSMMEHVSPCGYPEIDFAKLEADTPAIQFFEQVFEWEYMTYLFYHGMWARKCKWPELIDEDSGDPLFDKFLMAGASRVQVAIRRGMESVFSWFLKTGQIWGASGTPPIPGDDDYVSMIQELKEADQCDYDDRPGLIAATQGSNVLALTKSQLYWDLVNDVPDQLNIDNDIDREILVNFKVYRIVAVEQATPGDSSAWNVTIDRPYSDPSAKDMKHAVGALFVGAPWEIVVPTELVYLRNKTDLLPTYPLA
jgi:hypothetical protein